MLIDLIAGARPNFMKVAPLIRVQEARAAAGGPLRYRLVHTGQHYDPRLSGAFFEQLGIPAPDVNLEVGSGTQAEQTAAIMTRYERLLQEAPARLCLVLGDVTSTMACAIAAQMLSVPVAHVEGGIRSGDWSMPEEINRPAGKPESIARDGNRACCGNRAHDGGPVLTRLPQHPAGRAPALSGVQLPGQARQGRDHRLRRYHRGDHGARRTLPDPA